MATIRIRVENGRFVIDGQLTKHAETSNGWGGNGWSGDIYPDGTIRFECSKEYSDGLYSTAYTIRKDGFATLERSYPNGDSLIVKKGFVVKKGETVDGYVGLSGGRIDCRYAYFRTASFQDWLDEHRILQVVRQDPNGEFRDPYDVKIVTDGTPVPEDYHFRWFSACDSFQTHVLTSGATYVRMVVNREGESILYTLKNPMELNLAAHPVTSEEKMEYLNKELLLMNKDEAKAFAFLHGIREAYVLDNTEQGIETCPVGQLHHEIAGFRRADLEERDILDAALGFQGRMFENYVCFSNILPVQPAEDAQEAARLIGRVIEDLREEAHGDPYGFYGSINRAMDFVNNSANDLFVRAAVATVLVCGDVWFASGIRTYFNIPDANYCLEKFQAVKDMLGKGYPVYMHEGDHDCCFYPKEA